ncbi:MAG: hypothetical protein HC923_04000 [Myxococcales bacterium]|nr:hypothetical protein [Myxococcales bacterium]
MLGLLTTTHAAPGGSVVFVTGRHGWPVQIHGEKVAARDPSGALTMYVHPGRDWQNGAVAVIGRNETFLEAYRLAQPSLLKLFMSSWQRVSGRRDELIEETYPYLPETDLFTDVLAPAARHAPVFGLKVRRRELNAA